MNKRIVFILPYFGHFKNYFDMFLQSCENNETYDWIILTDNNISSSASNITIVQTTFRALREKFQSKFDFDISLDRPYKLCDFKPAYGYLFEEYINGYEYWGHCDSDVLFGNMPYFLDPLLDAGYDKLFAAGHLTIYKNNIINNRRFMLPDKEGVFLYRTALSHSDIFAFDEMYYRKNVHTLFRDSGALVYEKDLSFNISTRHWGIRRVFYNPASQQWETSTHKPRLLVWSGGSIASYHWSLKNNEQTTCKTWLYVHMQGRAMRRIGGARGNTSIEIGPDYLKPIQRPQMRSATVDIKRALEDVSIKSIRRSLGRLSCKLKRLSPTLIDPYARYIH